MDTKRENKTRKLFNLLVKLRNQTVYASLIFTISHERDVN